jgi:hypothetical protein
MITNLFRSKSQIEPAPEPAPDALDAARAEEMAAAAECAQLDLEYQGWQERRTKAYVRFCTALQSAAAAKGTR